MMYHKADTSYNLRLPFVSYKRENQSRRQQQKSELVKNDEIDWRRSWSMLLVLNDFRVVSRRMTS
jgi:hypothetical protein